MDERSLVAVRADRPGALPAVGKLEIAGVQLPAGRPESRGGAAHFWRSDVPLEDVGQYATALARVFEHTGLWPLVWMWSAEDAPEHYYDRPRDLRHLDAFTAEEVLRAGWAGIDTYQRAVGPFPGLAAPARQRGSAQPIRDPFKDIHKRVADPFDQESRWVLLLVPCRRPADAIAAIGWDHSFIPLVMTAAVLRSWEDRFGVVPVAIEPSSILLAVDAPVTDATQATALAAEILAVTESIDQREEHPSGWSEIAARLLGTGGSIHHSPPLTLEPSHWRLAFSEDIGVLEEDLARSRMGDDLDAYWES